MKTQQSGGAYALPAAGKTTLTRDVRHRQNAAALADHRRRPWVIVKT